MRPPLVTLGADGQPLPGPAARRERRDAADNRAAVVAAARALVDERGDDWTIADVAERAGVGKGTVYRHYTDVGRLCEAVLDDDTRRLQHTAMELVAGPGPALPRAAALLREIGAHVARNAPLLCRAPRGRPQPFHARAGGYQRVALHALLRQAARQGELVDADPDLCVDALLMTLDPALHCWQLEAGVPPETLTTTAVRLLEGLGRPAPAP